MTKERPVFVIDEHLTYLDKLRKSGITNMYAAAPYLRRAFDLDEKESHEVLGYWMASFGERTQVKQS